MPGSWTWLVQVPPETHADVTPPTLDADVETECPEPSLNVVEVTVAFHVRDPERHYHVPLLLSRFGYTTYRGS